jgi:adenylate cyclase
MIKNKIRMLAAVMFTDMVGYTALMQQNEQRAIMLRSKQKKILEDKIFEHKGQILQYYGDGTLSIFGSAIEAVLCAAEIQTGMLKEPKVPLRIGIHLGDIIYDDDGVYGDSVNIASRIENIAESGSVLISEKVFDEIKNQEDLEAVYIGAFELKNVKNPVNIYALSAKGLVIPEFESISKKTVSNKSSIAVLPFVNMSAESENEYFSDGITEEILNALSKVNGLLVTSRTSSFAFKGSSQDIRNIGAKLGVNNVLEGSVRKFSDRVRITAQLINTKDGYHIWSDTYDRKLEDIFAVQDEISKTIAEQLREKLSSYEKAEPLIKSETKNIEAYNLVLKGRYYWNKWMPDDIKKAISFFEEANKIDPEYALPYVGLSNCYLVLGALGIVSTHLSYPKAKEYALIALEKDSTLSDSHLSVALTRLFYDWDWINAEKSFLKALEIKKNSADAHHTYSIYLISQTRFNEALNHAEEAFRLDPLSLPINEWLGNTYWYLRRYDDAIAQHNKTLELDPHFRGSVYGLGFNYLAKGDFSKAIEYFEKAQKLAGNSLKGVTPLGYVYALSGQKEKAMDCLDRLYQRIFSRTLILISQLSIQV